MRRGLLKCLNIKFYIWGGGIIFATLLSACSFFPHFSERDQDQNNSIIERTFVVTEKAIVDVEEFEETHAVTQTVEPQAAFDPDIIGPETISQLAIVGKLRDLDSQNVELSFSPDSKLLAAATGSEYANVWNVEKQEIAFILEEHTWPVVNVTFSPDGHMLYTSASNGLINVWLYNRGYFSLDDQIFVGSEIFETAISHNGEKLVTCSADRWLRTWETQNNFPIFEKKHSSNCKSLGFSLDDQLILASMRQGSLNVWADFGVEIEEIRKIVGESYLSGPEIFPNGETLILGDGGRILLYRIEDGIIQQSIPAHDDFITNMSLSPDGRVLATAGLDQLVKIWDTSSWEVLATLNDHTGKIEQIRFSPDGRYLATADRSGKIFLWSLTSSNQ